MAFDTFFDFLAMGRHGSYVWSAYGLSIFALIALTWNTLAKRRRVRDTLVKRYLRSQTRS
ncbi:MAG: heme exporter protein D [Marinomonas primoryensis]|jgi:heme exporter protein D